MLAAVRAAGGRGAEVAGHELARAARQRGAVLAPWHTVVQQPRVSGRRGDAASGCESAYAMVQVDSGRFWRVVVVRAARLGSGAPLRQRRDPARGPAEGGAGVRARAGGDQPSIPPGACPSAYTARDRGGGHALASVQQQQHRESTEEFSSCGSSNKGGCTPWGPQGLGGTRSPRHHRAYVPCRWKHAAA